MTAPESPCYLSWPGLLCALGNDPVTIMQRLLAADNSGLVVDATLALAGPVHVGAVQAELPSVAPHLAAFDCRNNRLLLAALAQIETDVRAVIDRCGAARVAVVLGSSTAGISDGEAALAQWQASGSWPAGFDYRQQEVGTVAEFLARHLGLGNLAITISTACSSSAKAFASAQNLLAAGICDAVLVGGVDTLCKLTVNGFGALESLSSGRCTPFEAARDGINIGEGAALFVMTRTPGPLRLCAVGESSDAWHMSAPQPEGLGAERAMRAALAQARLQPEDIDYINLHGTATPKNDAMESAAVARVFGGEGGPCCSSTKALTGHTLGAAGAVEAALCALLLSAYNPRQQLPPQRFMQGPDPDLASIRFVGTAPAPQSIRYVLSNSFAFGGSNAVLILGAAFPAVEQLLPHARPMILIDRAIDIGATWLVAEVDISEQTLFAEAGRGVPTWVGIEYLAQSIAAWAGYGSRSKGGLPQFGFLLGTRKYHAAVPYFEFGSTLTVRVELQFQDQGLGVFNGSIATAQTLVEASVNVYQPDTSRPGTSRTGTSRPGTGSGIKT